ncbi:Creatinase/aminopeptidase [Ascoidea rubescens DSM 1968]|uniref:Creatinase/aminopeptidase n=1 Tax=Ascoidea rubescens DSM 1968 TaxID=1344418 RepID=A0A1D2VCS3_9ASCO|nr:Creatinase/aminopeptidase [Ascoidea rubescens DSM 1968]ODV59425.1 Creatinase/aminopeptidase [Ascoidea rubescens DSM 1968]
MIVQNKENSAYHSRITSPSCNESIKIDCCFPFLSLFRRDKGKYLHYDYDILRGGFYYEDNKDSKSKNLFSNNKKRLSIEKKAIFNDDEITITSDEPNPSFCQPRKYDSTNVLKKLRELMIENGIDVYIIPSEDEHQSEYKSGSDKRREFISGFTGSNGIAVVSLNNAALSTDGRYFLQAESQLDSNWFLIKQGVKGYLSWEDWAIHECSKSDSNDRKVISVDPKLISITTGDHLKLKCLNSRIEFKPLMNNLTDGVWGDKKPLRSLIPIFKYDLEYSGEEVSSKISRVRNILKIKESFGIVIIALDEIAWLLNLRGVDDVPYIPVFFSYVILTLDKLYFYINEKKVTDDVRKYLNDQIGDGEYEIKRYNKIWDDLALICFSNDNDKLSIILPINSTFALFNSLRGFEKYKFSNDIEVLKSIKNGVELKGMLNSNLKDSIALIRYFAWLEEQLIRFKKTDINEYEGGVKSESFRSEMEDYKGLSFETISSTGANASIIHYSPSFEVNSIIDGEKIYLCDSGGQYFDGTTDITRTMHFMRPSAEEKKTYTLVLKGHISVASAVFPQGTTGGVLDILARRPLWEYGLDYRHGTGHGIGCFNNIHEGPVGIGAGERYGGILQAGNVISDEPGYYKDGEFGIRIESDLEIIEWEDHKGNNGLNYLRFKYLTMVPMCQKLIDRKLLSKFEKRWLNEFHSKCREMVLPHLEALRDERAIQWLVRETTAL